MSRGRAKSLAVVGSALTALIGVVYVVSPWCGVEWGLLGIASGAIGSDGGWPTASDRPEFFWSFHSMVWWPVVDRMPHGYRLMVPLWIPLLATVVPTIFLARAARRHGPGLCPSCGYDLTGAPSATCPECGAERKA